MKQVLQAMPLSVNGSVKKSSYCLSGSKTVTFSPHGFLVSRSIHQYRGTLKSFALRLPVITVPTSDSALREFYFPHLPGSAEKEERGVLCISALAARQKEREETLMAFLM